MSGPAAVVVTGSSGIAGAVIDRLAAIGARVFVVDVDGDRLERVRGNPCVAGVAVADLRSETDAQEAFEAADRALGRIDGLVAVAGGSARRFGDGPLHEIPLAGWEASMSLNLTTTFLASREAIRRMRTQQGGGSIVLTSSVLASNPSPRFFSTHAYAAAKAAIAGLACVLAASYAPDGIRVNAVAPGLVVTPMSQRAASDEEIVDYVVAKQPIARGMLEPDDVASTMVTLLQSDRITGQVVAVDGGWSVVDPWAMSSGTTT
jgi:NAD(P)-dependent dehydrogenase (short-subunit alcohol dehydrogenase family)